LISPAVVIVSGATLALGHSLFRHQTSNRMILVRVLEQYIRPSHIEQQSGCNWANTSRNDERFDGTHRFRGQMRQRRRHMTKEKADVIKCSTFSTKRQNER
jgi:hypothetical protein